MLIQNTSPDMNNVLVQLLFVMNGHFAILFKMLSSTNKEKKQKDGVQSLLCRLIQFLLIKLLSRRVLLLHFNSFMTDIFPLLQTNMFRDISLTIGAGYEQYLQVSLVVVCQYALGCMPTDNNDLIYDVLTESIKKAYIGIMQGFSDA